MKFPLISLPFHRANESQLISYLLSLVNLYQQDVVIFVICDVGCRWFFSPRTARIHFKALPWLAATVHTGHFPFKAGIRKQCSTDTTNTRKTDSFTQTTNRHIGRTAHLLSARTAVAVEQTTGKNAKRTQWHKHEIVGVSFAMWLDWQCKASAMSCQSHWPFSRRKWGS